MNCQEHPDTAGNPDSYGIDVEGMCEEHIIDLIRAILDRRQMVASIWAFRDFDTQYDELVEAGKLPKLDRDASATLIEAAYPELSNLENAEDGDYVTIDDALLNAARELGHLPAL